jgi:hypothetical protein
MVRQSVGEQVSDAVSLVDYINDLDVVDPSPVEGLPSGGWIESCPVEVDAPIVVGSFDYSGFEFLEK